MAAKNEKTKSYLKPSEAAELLRVEPGTVRSWAQSGRLRSTTTPGGHRRFAYRDLVKFAAEHGISLALPAEGGLRVLVVDDDDQVRTLTARTLRSVDGTEVELAEDGFTAGRLLASFRPHVIVLDIFMPGINGLELCRTLKADPATADIRVIAMTGASDSEAARLIVECGAEQCLAKPVSREALLQAVGLTESAGAEPRP